MEDIIIDVGEFVILGRAENREHITCLQAFAGLTESDIGSDLIVRAVKWLVRYTGATHVKIRVPLVSGNWATATWPEAEKAWTSCPEIQKQRPQPHLITCPIHVRISCPKTCRTETKSGYIYAYRADVEPGKGGDQFFTTDAQFVKAVAQIISLQLQTEGNRVAMG